MLKVLLSSAWYHVVQADALAGLSAILRRVKPDLIVTAVNLPDGRAQMLRSDPRLADVPIIAITAQNDHGARMAALAAGIDDVLCHPLDDTLLQARIRSLIRARTADQELRASGAAPRRLRPGRGTRRRAPAPGAGRAGHRGHGNCHAVEIETVCAAGTPSPGALCPGRRAWMRGRDAAGCTDPRDDGGHAGHGAGPSVEPAGLGRDAARGGDCRGKLAETRRRGSGPGRRRRDAPRVSWG
ncbi:PleD family two-component system response regulator [Jhaorihella thermophila]